MEIVVVTIATNAEGFSVLDQPKVVRGRFWLELIRRCNQTGGGGGADWVRGTKKAASLLVYLFHRRHCH